MVPCWFLVERQADQIDFVNQGGFIWRRLRRVNKWINTTSGSALTWLALSVKKNLASSEVYREILKTLGHPCPNEVSFL